jgi:hypothetical protein
VAEGRGAVEDPSGPEQALVLGRGSKSAPVDVVISLVGRDGKELISRRHLRLSHSLDIHKVAEWLSSITEWLGTITGWLGITSDKLVAAVDKTSDKIQQLSHVLSASIGGSVLASGAYSPSQLAARNLWSLVQNLVSHAQ